MSPTITESVSDLWPFDCCSMCVINTIEQFIIHSLFMVSSCNFIGVRIWKRRRVAKKNGWLPSYVL